MRGVDRLECHHCDGRRDWDRPRNDGTGATTVVVDSLMTANVAVGGGNLLMLAAMFTITVILTNMITAKAAAMLVIEVALVAAAEMNVSPAPFTIAVIMGAAGSFATPFGYQTTMMVYGPAAIVRRTICGWEFR